MDDNGCGPLDLSKKRSDKNKLTRASVIKQAPADSSAENQELTPVGGLDLSKKRCDEDNEAEVSGERKQTPTVESVEGLASTTSCEFESKPSTSHEVQSTVKFIDQQSNLNVEQSEGIFEDLTDDPSKCSICKDLDPNVAAGFHNEAMIYGSKNHICDVCQKTFHCKFYLSEHKVKDHDQKFYERCECSFTHDI